MLEKSSECSLFVGVMSDWREGERRTEEKMREKRPAGVTPLADIEEQEEQRRRGRQ
jgi:hypothetical protein